MSRFGFVGPSYTDQAVTADCQRCMNWYVEKIESGDGAAPFVLLPTPGLAVFAALPESLVRGVFSITSRVFAAAGDTLYEVFPDGTFTSRGTIGTDGRLVTFAATPQQMLLASSGTAYVFDLIANTLTAIPGATFSGPVSVVGVCDDFFIAVIANSKEFYVSAALDATDWVSNGSAIVSVFPENIVGMLVDHREIWFFSPTQSVVYYDSGDIFPFDVIPSAFIEAGMAAEFSPVQLDNTVFWLGADSRGNGVVWRGYGYTPQRVSNHAVEFALQSYSRIDDAIGFPYQDQGHQFYVLYFPSANATWVYDTVSGLWHERGYWNLAIGQYGAAHYQCHTFAFAKHLVGDWNSGNIYQMHIPVYAQGKWIFADDNGNPIRRMRRAPHIAKEQKYVTYAELQVYAEAGLGSNA